jgi:hypothetical protein
VSEWTPDQCRAKRWDGRPSFEGPHPPHLFYYGPFGMYVGSCNGRGLATREAEPS